MERGWYVRLVAVLYQPCDATEVIAGCVRSSVGVRPQQSETAFINLPLARVFMIPTPLGAYTIYIIII